MGDDIGWTQPSIYHSGPMPSFPIADLRGSGSTRRGRSQDDDLPDAAAQYPVVQISDATRMNPMCQDEMPVSATSPGIAGTGDTSDRNSGNCARYRTSRLGPICSILRSGIDRSCRRHAPHSPSHMRPARAPAETTSTSERIQGRLRRSRQQSAASNLSTSGNASELPAVAG